jgi:hypothetical protein
MRILAVLAVALSLAGPAAAAVPRFGVFDLDTDLARASLNTYGDVRVASRQAALARRAPGATIVRCGRDCRLGAGWLAFAKGPNLGAGDVAAAAARRVGGTLWKLRVTLTGRGSARWAAFSRRAAARARARGLPDVFAVVVQGSVVATPFASDARHTAGTLELRGFSRAAAEQAARALRRTG